MNHLKNVLHYFRTKKTKSTWDYVFIASDSVLNYFYEWKKSCEVLCIA